MTAAEGIPGRVDETGKMRRTPDQSPLGSIEAYRQTLIKAGLSEFDANSKTNAYAATHPIIAEQIVTQTPVKLSRRASACIQAARDANIPDDVINSAVEHAMQAAVVDNRRKAGLFGTSGGFIRDLRDRAGIVRGTKGYALSSVANKPRF